MDETTIKQRQKEIDEEYLRDGLTDEVVDKQIELNKIRHEHDINTDDDLNDEGYAQ